jgi:AraC-like DNA-binding protein
VVPGDTPYGRLIRDQLSALQRCAASLTEAQGQAAVRAVASLAAGAVGPQAAAQETAREALIAAIKDHIETNLESARLDVESLCLHFGLSRASLYRLFEHEGGFAGYVRDRRLFRAMAILRSPQCRHHRIIDLAHECHFSSDTTFIRAFRRLFGVTPGEVRALTDLHQVLGAGRGSNDAFSEFGPGYWSARWPREGGAWLDARSKNGV